MGLLVGGWPTLRSLKGGIAEYRSREIFAGAGDKLTSRKTQIQVMLILSSFVIQYGILARARFESGQIGLALTLGIADFKTHWHRLVFRHD